jgi:hypothetical protein
VRKLPGRFDLPKFKKELKEFYARMGLSIPEAQWKRFEELIDDDEGR